MSISGTFRRDFPLFTPHKCALSRKSENATINFLNRGCNFISVPLYQESVGSLLYSRWRSMAFGLECNQIRKMESRLMNNCNFNPCTVWIGDNLDIMRGINSKCIDLIYLDPPFNSNRSFENPIGMATATVDSPEDEIGSFKDIWRLSDLKKHEHGELADTDPGVYKVIDAAGETHGESMKAYLIFMAVRLIQIERILKDEGSVYLHCDDTAVHYLKLIMDGLFGIDMYSNDIGWRRNSGGKADAKKQFARNSDHILFYSNRKVNIEDLSTTRNDDWIEKYFAKQDEKGRYQSVTLFGQGTRDGETGEIWKGIDPNKKGKHWSAPRTGKYAKIVVSELIPGYLDEPSVMKRLDLLDENGLIEWTSNGQPRLKQYFDREVNRGTLDSYWDDIKALASNDRERTNYPTQKPIALLERIIKASSDPGDLVFDPFCGCATTMVAANKLGRNWIGCDLSEVTVGLVKKRIDDAKGTLPGLFDSNAVITLNIPPVRTDIAGDLPNYKSNRHLLFSIQKGICVGCHNQFPFHSLTVDHIVPKSKGGQDNFENLQLMCGFCNASKGTKSMAKWMATRDESYFPIYNNKFNPRLDST